MPTPNPSAVAEHAALFGTLINRRVTIRRPCGAQTQATMAKQRRTPFQRARIHDISQGGVALVLRQAPAAGTTIFLQLTNSLLGFTYDLAAEVRHATPHRGGTWLVGLAFDRELSTGELAALI